MHVAVPSALALVVAAAGLAGWVDAAGAAECSCRLRGGEVPIGSLACLSPNGSAGLYRCQMNLNLTSWVRVAEGCPSAALSPPLRRGAAAPSARGAAPAGEG